MRLEELFTQLQKSGRVLVVDQPFVIGALQITIARQMGIQVIHLPGLATRRIARPTSRQRENRRRGVRDR